MKKFKRLFCIVCMLVLSLAACGKQDTDDGVKKFYNSMNDTTEAVGESTQSGLKAAAEENGKSVKKSSDILIVSDINSANAPAFPRRAYAVLAVVSNCYPPRLGNFPGITHPSAARRQK